MITGESPDVNRDYELFKQIKDFNKTLTECKDSLDSIAADMKKISGSKSTQSIAAIENMSRVLKQMIKSPYVAQQYVKDYYNIDEEYGTMEDFENFKPLNDEEYE